ncbi:AMP-binding protein, partial [Thermus scotoductus]|uniref:AMP-binding protein n=1 Tax=Thermus scotoductus TaxID=37636 RepID=UPI00264841FF
MAWVVAVNTSPMYPARELGPQLRDLGARGLVLLDLLLPRDQGVKAESPVGVLVRTGIQDYLPFPTNLLYPLMLKRKGQAPRSLEGTPWRAFLKPGNHQPVTLDLDDLALLQYTGGTTGVAKGAMLTHRHLSSNAPQVRSSIPDYQTAEAVALEAIP